MLINPLARSVLPEEGLSASKGQNGGWQGRSPCHHTFSPEVGELGTLPEFWAVTDRTHSSVALFCGSRPGSVLLCLLNEGDPRLAPDEFSSALEAATLCRQREAGLGCV